MKRFLVVLFAVFTFALLGVIVFNTEFASVDSLIRPPRIEGANHEIQAAFETAVGEKYIFKSPLSGEYRTSFIRTDFDNDNEEEVVVFYCYPDAVDVVRMNILDIDDGVWESVADLESAYNDVYQILFADLDKDGTKELIICWRNFETELSNKLEVYKVSIAESGGIKSIFSKNYHKFLVCDADADSQTDIIIFEKNASNNFNGINGVYYEFSNGESFVAGEFVVDHAITSVGEVCCDREAGTGNLRIYIDGYKTDSGMTTDIVLWDNVAEAFHRMPLSDSRAVSVLASRSTNVNCKDIDGDSEINIPLEEYIPESVVVNADSGDEALLQSVLKWVEHNGDDFDTVSYELLNPKYSYSLLINSEQYGSFTVENDISGGTLTFYELYQEDEPKKDKKPKKKDEPFSGFAPDMYEDEQTDYHRGKELFTILAAKDVAYGVYEFSGFKQIGSANGFDYYCQITEAGKEYSITKEKIESMLII